ncbi:MAG: GNAT family N-acetyltransferase [Actinomycetia bacterium]|nr:GNAT family N-acetyltransferase [Actinomycetes bacterium]
MLTASRLFDAPPRVEWAECFLRSDGRHLLLAVVDRTPVGSITGIEICHQGKDVEMLLEELSVDEPHRLRGYGSTLVTAGLSAAGECGCRSIRPSPRWPSPRIDPLGQRARSPRTPCGETCPRRT